MPFQFIKNISFHYLIISYYFFLKNTTIVLKGYNINIIKDGVNFVWVPFKFDQIFLSWLTFSFFILWLFFLAIRRFLHFLYFIPIHSKTSFIFYMPFKDFFHFLYLTIPRLLSFSLLVLFLPFQDLFYFLYVFFYNSKTFKQYFKNSIESEIQLVKSKIRVESDSINFLKSLVSQNLNKIKNK